MKQRWQLSLDVTRAGFDAHEAARQRACPLTECLINYWAACFRAMDLTEEKARTACVEIFGGTQTDHASAVKVGLAIEKLKDLGVWPW